jgi:hypothetical protein
MIYFWSTVAILSIGFNIFLILYIRENLNFLKTVRDDLHNSSEVVSSFMKHLDKVYNLDTFYGDSTLEGLLQHVKDTSEELKKNQEVIEGYFDA